MAGAFKSFDIPQQKLLAVFSLSANLPSQQKYENWKKNLRLWRGILSFSKVMIGSYATEPPNSKNFWKSPNTNTVNV